LELIVNALLSADNRDFSVSVGTKFFQLSDLHEPAPATVNRLEYFVLDAAMFHDSIPPARLATKH
jgi:hypothetical protein